MKIDFDAIGRYAAIVSSILLMAVLINLWVLNSASFEHESISFLEPAMAVTPTLVPDVERAISVSESDSPSIAQVLGRIAPQQTKLLAYIYYDGLNQVSADGRVYTQADSLDHQNLPILSAPQWQIDETGSVLQTPGAQQALNFLQIAKGDPAIFRLISQVRVDESSELVVYMNWGRVVPVKMGRGNWTEKLDHLNAYFQQLGSSELTMNAKYLDLRIKDRIVVKKQSRTLG